MEFCNYKAYESSIKLHKSQHSPEINITWHLSLRTPEHAVLEGEGVGEGSGTVVPSASPLLHYVVKCVHWLTLQHPLNFN